MKKPSRSAKMAPSCDLPPQVLAAKPGTCRPAGASEDALASDTQRLLHELQVHQVELELQNAELLAERTRSARLLKQYTCLYDLSPVFYFTLTPEGTISMANLTSASLLGIERKKLIGLNFSLHVSASQREQFHAFLAAALDGTLRREADFTLTLNDGTQRIVKLRTQAATTDHECSVVMVDITERKLEAERLAISEIRYRRLFEAAQDGVLLLDYESGKITAVNPFMCKLLAYPQEELIGKELWEIGRSDDARASQAIFLKIKKDRQVRYEDLPLQTRDGRLQEVEVVANLYEENGVNVIQCNIRDITARKLADNLLRASEARLDVGVEVGGLALAEVYYESGVKHLSAAAARMFGLGTTALIVPRHEVHALVHPGDLPRLEPILTASLDPDGTGWLATEHRIIRPDGAVRWLRVREKIIFDGPATARYPVHGTMALIDVTEEKLISEAMRTSKERMRLAADATHVGIWEWNILRNEVRWDAQMFHIYGIEPTADGLVTYATWSSAVLPEELPEQEKILVETVRALGRGTRNFRILRASDGERRDIECFEAVRTNEVGEAEWVVGTNLDVTARRQVSDSLMESKLRLTLGVQVAGLALADVDYRTGLNHLSAEAAALYGLGSGPMAVPRAMVHGTFHPDDLAEIAPLAAESLNPKGVGCFSMDHRVVWPNGEVHWLRVRKQVYFEGEGNARQPVRATLAAFDVTHEKNVMESLRRNEALFTALIQQAPVGVYVVDAQFRLQQMNSIALADFLNVTPAMGQDFSEIVHALWSCDTANAIVAAFRHTLDTGEPYQAPDLAARRKDTKLMKVYEWSLQRVTLPSGDYGVVCFYNDSTARNEEEKVQRRLAVMTATNKRLEREMVRRLKIEDALKASQQTAIQLLSQSQQLQEQQRHLSRQIIVAQEEERKRVSRELHDVIAQSLTSINYRLAALQTQATENPASLQERIIEAQQSVAHSVDTVHRFARDLRPSMLDDLGLMPALRTYVQEFTQRTHLPVDLSADASAEGLAADARTAFYRITQEALANILRHAKATEIRVKLSQQGKSACLEITDNGVGFAMENAKQNRLGLLGMRERVEMIGGRFSIQSQPGGPTKVSVSLPS